MEILKTMCNLHYDASDFSDRLDFGVSWKYQMCIYVCVCEFMRSDHQPSTTPAAPPLLVRLHELCIWPVLLEEPLPQYTPNPCCCRGNQN